MEQVQKENVVNCKEYFLYITPPILCQCIDKIAAQTTERSLVGFVFQISMYNTVPLLVLTYAYDNNVIILC